VNEVSKKETPKTETEEVEEESSGKSGERNVSLPSGTRDTLPEQMVIREKAFAIIKRVFSRHGAVSIDTPVFERKSTLAGKYGEDSKLIYDLADQGGALLSLRYDLTVPFARYLATHGVRDIKRYHIGRVYRRDNPAMARGRFREFFQCDFDIAGQHQLSTAADAECVAVMAQILDELEIGRYQIKINNRQLLDAFMEVCGVPGDKFKTLCSSIDKLDKEPWEKICEEIVAKGISRVVASKIGDFVMRRGAPAALLAEFVAHPLLKTHEGAQKALSDLRGCFGYVERFGYLSRIAFEPSLARGLDYYTGVIMEATLTDTDRVGSISGGGRYDDLVGMFCKSKVPAVGFSIGIERILTILEEQERKRGSIRSTETQVLVCSVGKDMVEQRMVLCGELWRAGVAAEFVYHDNPRGADQMKVAVKDNIPYVVFIGENEVKAATVKFKDMANKTEVDVPRATAAQIIAQRCGMRPTTGVTTAEAKSRAS